MQWTSLVGKPRGDASKQPGLFDEEPLVGELDPQTARQLAAVLRQHTTTPDDCCFGIWDGWGRDMDSLMQDRPVFSLPGREYYLGTGPLSDLALRQPVSLAWPADRAWLLATEIDLDSTYLGGSQECVSEVLACPALEAFPAAPGDRVTFDADPLNPVPQL